MLSNLFFYFLEFFRDAYAYFEIGGTIMIPLFIISIVLWILIIERELFLKGEFVSAQKVYLEYRNAKNGNAQSIGEKIKNTIIYNVITSVLASKHAEKRTQLKILNEKILQVKPKINKNLHYISMLTIIAPLLGLLGTVFGLVTTFDMMTIFGSGNVKAFAGGISEALITTETGLIIAIPGYFFSNKLNKKAMKIKHELYSLNHIINQIM